MWNVWNSNAINIPAIFMQYQFRLQTIVILKTNYLSHAYVSELLYIDQSIQNVNNSKSISHVQ